MNKLNIKKVNGFIILVASIYLLLITRLLNNDNLIAPFLLIESIS